MEQKDYLLREIEKIGAIFRAIRERLLGGKEGFAISTEQQMVEAKGMLIEHLGFDLDFFIQQDNQNSIQYLNTFNGFNDKNLTSLATLLSAEDTQVSLQKAIMLYQYIDDKTKTFSFNRQKTIRELQARLYEI